MKVKDLIKLMPNETILFIQTDVMHYRKRSPSALETFEESFKVGSCEKIPSAELEVQMIGALETRKMHVITEIIDVEED